MGEYPKWEVLRASMIPRVTLVVGLLTGGFNRAIKVCGGGVRLNDRRIPRPEVGGNWTR